jgi:hypothetical protein
LKENDVIEHGGFVLRAHKCQDLTNCCDGCAIYGELEDVLTCPEDQKGELLCGWDCIPEEMVILKHVDPIEALIIEIEELDNDE